MVNIYLIANDSRQPINSWLNTPNPQSEDGDNPLGGEITYQVNDTWWQGSQGATWSGSNVSFEYFFVITRSTETLDSQPPQATFTAVRKYACLVF